MITVVGGIKGGCGKTTIATNLCVMRSQVVEKVLLVDADEQRTASDWSTQRELSGEFTNWTSIILSGKAIHLELRKMKEDYDDIIIDVGGRDTTNQRAALTIANICILPFKPKGFDIWTIGAVKNMIDEIWMVNPSLKVYTLITQADCKGTENEEAREFLCEIPGFICIPHTIGHRKSFSRAASDGLAVFEHKKSDEKSIEEMSRVYEYIYGI